MNNTHEAEEATASWNKVATYQPKYMRFPHSEMTPEVVTFWTPDSLNKRFMQVPLVRGPMSLGA